MKTKGLEFVNRMQREGFKKYFSQRPVHFRDIYGYSYTDESVHIAYQESMDLVQKCRGGESSWFL